jgi:hypothetical protein
MKPRFAHTDLGLPGPCQFSTVNSAQPAQAQHPNPSQSSSAHPNHPPNRPLTPAEVNHILLLPGSPIPVKPAHLRTQPPHQFSSQSAQTGQAQFSPTSFVSSLFFFSGVLSVCLAAKLGRFLVYVSACFFVAFQYA